MRCACPSPAAHLGRRVVLTGGPGAGKTAVLEVVRRQLCGHVVVLPEAATVVYGGGFPRRATPGARRAAQVAIFHVQHELEQLALDEPAALVLCDRALVDGMAYWPGDRESFERAVGATREELFARYAAVVHLRTPGSSNGYNHQNPLRIETPEQAAAIDRALFDVWEGHPRRFVVDPSADFLEKLDRTLSLLMAELPPCCEVPRTPRTG